MKWFISTLVIGAVALIAAAPIGAQPPGGGGRMMGGGGYTLIGLVGQKSVQADLKLTDDESKNVEKVVAKSREAMGDLRSLGNEERREKMQAMGAANEKALAEVLSADQMKRLKQITLQAQGVAAVERPEVAEALALTSEQKEKLQTIRRDLGSEMRDLGGGEDREAAAKKMTAARKAATEKMLGIFTDAQKAKWTELSGEPFNGDLAPGGGGGRCGGNRPAGAGAGGRGARPTNDV
jgi:hypothetical protein